MGYRKTGSTVIMVENTELTEKVNNIEGELDKSNKQSVTLTHGLQVVNAEQNSPLDVSIEGRTLVNLRGKSGRGNNVTNNYGANSTQNQVTDNGNDFLEYTATVATEFGNYFDIKVDSSKYYLLVAKVKKGVPANYTQARIIMSVGGSFTNYFSKTFNLASDELFIYQKFSPAEISVRQNGNGEVRILTTAYSGAQVGDKFLVRHQSLMEITQDEYNAIGTTWDDAEVARRYPYVDSVQHVQNPYVIAEGENLLPPFTEWTLHANAKVKSPYELELNATGVGQISTFYFGTINGQQYTFKLENTTASAGNTTVEIRKNDGTFVKSTTGTNAVTFTANDTKMQVRLFGSVAGTFTFTNPMLTLGNQAKPFVPRNPSALYAEMKLGALSDKKDILYRSNGEWLLRKSVEKDVKLDGSLAWAYITDDVGFKHIGVSVTTNAVDHSQKVIKYDGKILSVHSTAGAMTLTDQSVMKNGYTSTTADKDFALTISDTDSGWGESYTPTANEIKAYFWGWRMCDGTYGNKWTGTGTKTWHPIGDTDLNRAVTSVPTSAAPTITEGKIDYYKLSYVLATPQTINVTDKVEGELVVNGATQVETGSGVIVREKITPLQHSSDGHWFINEKGLDVNVADTPLKNRTNDILFIYRNQIRDNKWAILKGTSNGNGGAYAKISNEDYDTSAEYTVTYLLLDRHQFTNNLLSAPSTYNSSLKSVVDDVVAKQADISSTVSVHVRAIAELYKRVKALGG